MYRIWGSKPLRNTSGKKHKILNDFEVDVSQRGLKETDIQLFWNLGCINRNMASRKREVIPEVYISELTPGEVRSAIRCL